jgi:hypothetical protein
VWGRSGRSSNTKVNFSLSPSQSHDKRNLTKIQIISFKNESLKVNHYSCISECPNSTIDFFNRCNKYGESDYQTIHFGVSRIVLNLVTTWHYIVMTCALAFVLSTLVLFLFCHALNYITWAICGIFIMSLGFVLVKTIILYKAAQYGAFIVFIAMLLFTSLIGFVPIISVWQIFSNREKLRKIPYAFREVSKYFCNTPGIFFQPLLVSVINNFY